MCDSTRFDKVQAHAIAGLDQMGLVLSNSAQPGL